MMVVSCRHDTHPVSVCQVERQLKLRPRQERRNGSAVDNCGKQLQAIHLGIVSRRNALHRLNVHSAETSKTCASYSSTKQLQSRSYLECRKVLASARCPKSRRAGDELEGK